MTLEIKLGQTHCDTIGDFFKNPLLYRFLKEYHDLNYKNASHAALRTWKSFTPEFYELVRDIFSNYTHMKEFLRRIRTQYMEDSSILKNFTEDQLTQTLLVFEQLHQYLSSEAGYNWTVSGLFQKLVADIVWERKKEFIELDREEPEKWNLDSKNSLYTGLLDAVKLWIALTSDGKTVYLQGKVKEDIFKVMELGSFEEMLVNQHGTIIPPFEKPKLTLVSNNEAWIAWKNAVWARGQKIWIPLKSVK